MVMILSILTFAFEMIVYIVAQVLIQAKKLSVGGAWGIIFIFIAITIVSIIALIMNIRNISRSLSKAKAIVGTAFAGSALFFAAIFDITLIVTLAVLL